MKLIERRQILKTALERSANPYSEELVEVTRRVGSRILRAQRAETKSRRKELKNIALANSGVIWRSNASQKGFDLGRLNAWGNKS